MENKNLLYLKKIMDVSEDFLTWLYHNIRTEDINSYLSKEDSYKTRFIWYYLNNFDINKETFTMTLDKYIDSSDERLRSKACVRLYDYLCSARNEIIVSNHPFGYKIKEYKNPNIDVIFEDIEYDVKLSTCSDYIYNNIVIKLKEENNRLLTNEEEAEISDLLYYNQLKSNTERNNFTSNKIHIILADKNKVDRFKSKMNFSKIEEYVRRYLNNKLLDPPKARKYINPETGEILFLYSIVIIVY